MQSHWNDEEAQACKAQFADAGEDIALRVYTSRLIGADPSLVLHGGGNTSVKTTARDALGRLQEVVAVKGSGWDLRSLAPAGLPMVAMAPLLELRAVGSLSDEEMVNQLRIHMLDAGAPTPSVETLLHAFLPERFVDHTHADAILALTNHDNGEALIRAALGDDVPVLGWIMPGLPLAKAVADCYEQHPGCQGIVLLHHGLFTFGADARTSYERMIRLVDAAERYLAAASSGRVLMTVPLAVGAIERAPALARAALPVVRGCLARAGLRMIAAWRGAADLVAVTGSDDCARLFALGPLTPDHVIRTKGWYLTLDAETATNAAAADAAIAAYAERYRVYFEAHRHRVQLPDGRPPNMLDPLPRVVLVQGAGLLAFGADANAAAIAADIAEHTLRGKAMAQAVGEYAALDPGDLFEMEYWSLEQAKLGRSRPARLAGRIAMITGAGGAIGHGVAESLLQAGAVVMLVDIDHDRLDRVARDLAAGFGGARIGQMVADVTDEASVAAAFDACVLRFGGLDILVPNAGIAHVSDLSEMDLGAFARTVEVNLTGTMTMLKHGARLFAAQGCGGCVVIQASKNVFAPGASFGAYSASKAGAHQLGKVAAIELAGIGVRVNMINADAVFGDAVPSGLWQQVGPQRMRARGLDADGLRDYYRQRSLLGIEVTPQHVGEAVVYLATAEATTGVTLTVDGGIAQAFPR